MSNLVVLKFSTPEGAQQGLELAAHLQKEHLLKIVDAATVVVATRLDGDAIVACIKDTILDQHVTTCFGIATVVVRPVRLDMHAAHDDVQHGEVGQAGLVGDADQRAADRVQGGRAHAGIA